MHCTTDEMPAKLSLRFRHLKMTKSRKSTKSTKFSPKWGKFSGFQKNSKLPSIQWRHTC